MIYENSRNYKQAMNNEHVNKSICASLINKRTIKSYYNRNTYTNINKTDKLITTT